MSSCNGVVLQPHPCRNMDGLGCSPFARHYWGNHCLFSLPAGTKMFQFPAFASYFVGYRSFRPVGCPIRKSADQWSFAPTRSLSQLITSFIASESQGIRHVPFLTCLTSLTCARSVYTFSLYLFTFQFCFCNIMSKIVCPMINTWTKWRITDSNR